jgi:chorismate dehydratase
MQLGRIGYINCYPVYGAIDRGIVRVNADLVTGTPAELNGLLAAGELDISAVSAVEYARNADTYRLLPDLAVSCDGPVRSVALFAKRDVRELDGATVLVSASSRTSVHLLKLLCQDVWHVQPNLVEARTEAEDLGGLAELPHEGVLVIGDAALLLAAAGRYPQRYDLGEAWQDWTGLPFVFAVWAARREPADRRTGGATGSRSTYAKQVQDVHRALLASRDWGLAHLDALAAEAARETGIDRGRCAEYLSGLDYALSYRHLEGLTSFFRRLAARGLVPDGTLRFLSVA